MARADIKTTTIWRAAPGRGTIRRRGPVHAVVPQSGRALEPAQADRRTGGARPRRAGRQPRALRSGAAGRGGHARRRPHARRAGLRRVLRPDRRQMRRRSRPLPRSVRRRADSRRARALRGAARRLSPVLPARGPSRAPARLARVLEDVPDQLGVLARGHVHAHGRPARLRGPLRDPGPGGARQRRAGRAGRLQPGRPGRALSGLDGRAADRPRTARASPPSSPFNRRTTDRRWPTGRTSTTPAPACWAP